MLKAIYTPLSGGLSQERALEVISNNLANVNTTGFKGENVQFKVLESEPYDNYPSPIPEADFKSDMSDYIPAKGSDISYVGIGGVYRDFKQGTAVKTDNKTDMMIQGDGFFGVMTEEGMRYTRDGSFHINESGQLAAFNGGILQGERGAIRLEGPQFTVRNNGDVIQNDQVVDRVALFDFAEKKQLERVGSNQFFYGGPEDGLLQIANPSVEQGFLEGSNVDPIQNMTAMILAHRSYEAYQKSVSHFDQMMDKSSNTIGTVRA